jgi:hypothetical protein
MSRAVLPGSTLVYFIQGETTKLIKIGQTRKKCPCERLTEIQAMGTEKLIVLGVIDCAKDGFYHKKFQSDWHHSEWFNPSPQLLDFIEHNTRKLTCDCAIKYDIGYKPRTHAGPGRRPLEKGGSALQNRHNSHHYDNPDPDCSYCQKRAQKKKTPRALKVQKRRRLGAIKGGRLGGLISACVRTNIKNGLPCKCGYHKTAENKAVSINDKITLDNYQ